MTERSVERFLNYVDDPRGELWSLRVRSKPTRTEIGVGETDRNPFHIVLDGVGSNALAEYVRATPEQRHAGHHSVDIRTGEPAYFSIGEAGDGRWRLMFSRRSGDVELFVDQPTMSAIVEAITGSIDSRSGLPL